MIYFNNTGPKYLKTKTSFAIHGTGGNFIDSKTNSNNPVVYQICTRPYHTINNCWNRHDIIDEPNAPQQALAAFQEFDDHVFYAYYRANAHMTNEEDKLISKKKYNGNIKCLLEMEILYL